MIPLPIAIARARETGDWSNLVEAVPFARWLGLSAEVVAGELLTTMRFEPKLIGNFSIPALHGGALGGLLEAAAVFALLHGAEDVKVPRVINVTVEYLRPGRPRDVHAGATITKLGRRVANVRASAWHDDRAQPIAVADAHFLVGALPPKT